MEDCVQRQAVSEQLGFIEFRTGFLQESVRKQDISDFRTGNKQIYAQKASVAMTQPILLPICPEKHAYSPISEGD